jgi:hypothetical protein
MYSGSLFSAFRRKILPSPSGSCPFLGNVGNDLANYRVTSQKIFVFIVTVMGASNLAYDAPGHVIFSIHYSFTSLRPIHFLHRERQQGGGGLKQAPMNFGKIKTENKRKLQIPKTGIIFNDIILLV